MASDPSQPATPSEPSNTLPSEAPRAFSGKVEGAAELPQAKILQGRMLRTLIVVLILGGTVFGVRWFLQNQHDTGDSFAGTVESSGMVEALEYGRNGQQVVAFGADGKKITQKGVEESTNDRDPVWRPDGNRIFFVSDRSGKGFQVYRWTPRPGETSEVRSQGSLGKSGPSFAANATGAESNMLLVSGGVVLEFDPRDLKGHQILPPTSSEITQQNDPDNGGGATGQFGALYGKLGDSFRTARWCFGTDAIAAVMRGDQGEQLIIQELPKVGEKIKPPRPIVIGERIDFDVNPKDGSIVFCVQKVHVPAESGKIPSDQRATHLVGWFKQGDTHATLIGGSTNDDQCFGSPTISPVGDKMMMTVGTFDSKSGTMLPKALIILPVQETGMKAGALLVQGEVYEPTWSPKADLIAYAKHSANGSRAIYISKPDGFGEHTLTGDVGNYGYPKFSPQTKTQP